MDNLLRYLDYLLQAQKQGVKLVYSIEQRITDVCNKLEDVLLGDEME